MAWFIMLPTQWLIMSRGSMHPHVTVPRSRVFKLEPSSCRKCIRHHAKCVDVRGDHGAVQATLQHGDLVIHRAAGQDVNWNEFITSIFEGYVLCLEKKNP